MSEFVLNNVAEALENHGFKTLVFETKEEAMDWLKNGFPAVETVGHGGSVTLGELDFVNIMIRRGFGVYSHAFAKTPEEKADFLKRANNADAYFMSANAVTADGMIFNVDGSGNRVSAMTFGPKKVYYMVGKNKIVKDLAAAQERLETIAAPKNVARLNLATGCAKTGRCMDCNAPKRICNAYVTLARAPWSIEESWVILINEDLGY